MLKNGYAQQPVFSDEELKKSLGMQLSYSFTDDYSAKSKFKSISIAASCARWNTFRTYRGKSKCSFGRTEEKSAHHSDSDRVRRAVVGSHGGKGVENFRRMFCELLWFVHRTLWVFFGYELQSFMASSLCHSLVRSVLYAAKQIF